MNKLFLVFLLSLFTQLFHFKSDPAVSIILTKQETADLFPDHRKTELGINFPIRRVYKCSDESGHFYILLTEGNDSLVNGKDTLHRRVRGFCFQTTDTGLVKQFELNDFVVKQPNSDILESSIWFWTKYCEMNDIDNDNLIDPILVYGTSGMNFTDDGRIKILIYYKGQKIAIRHQNGVLDSERNTKVDESFYTLPASLQDHVKSIMEKMIAENNAIFPAGWQDAMKAHKLFFDENR